MIRPGEALEEALKREMQEELLCNVRSKGLLGKYFEERPDKPWRLHSDRDLSTEIESKMTPVAEVEEIGWFDAKEVLKIKQAPNIPLTIEDIQKMGSM